MKRAMLWGTAVVSMLCGWSATFAADPVCKDKTTNGSISPATNNIPGVMYFNSKPKDAAACAMRVVDGKIVVDPAVSNPAMSCPDMAAWKLFADAVTQEFWNRWAADQQTWPNKPLPICTDKVTTNCCNPSSNSNPGYTDKENPAVNCPYFPGDHLGEGAPRLREAGPLSKAHFNAMGRRNSDGNLRAPNIDDTGRDIRQSMAEIVFRNKSMFDFVFRNDIYHQEGIAAVFNRNAANISGSTAGLPYRLTSTAGALTEIDFPIDAVMIKSNWLEKGRAQALGLRDDPNAPYIKMTINTRVTDNNGSILVKGEHWLVAMHISSKDIPNWLWATWEHVNNPGRCDYIGCNDSYGYSTADKVGANQATNYTTPFEQCDDLDLASWIFKLNQVYPSGPRSEGLSAIFQGMGIGTAKASYDNPETQAPTPADRAWLSYRLKGSQTEFTDSTGGTTLLGNSVTEGGFMQTSSCITCHARAGTTAKGTIPLALGVFVNSLNETGYLQSENGTPDPNLYYASNQPPALTVLQTDFVWGFLTANCLNGASLPCPVPPAADSANGAKKASPKAAPAVQPARSARERIHTGTLP
ncbi:hypothetical protein [Tahibacter amnicola]|uniref:Cytochrome c domain-containing protein n=1 Tax=Tahibacter amnicola TaxID=2976241 RepID=A0ABY6BIE1_9GAMM|nr:hypothetical protein [Tahibacter amnicola]UXI69769.1 hypothetical protein N4264_09100 [Tahibacter amnicola]